ncbi:hypothetical protein HNQ99_002680 [Rhizorhapis suberifaciens]|uniref:Uncharacterized protein n=1 Tax=Rhizorhapis suberifaciens TaxID=13656 RepID=A0A840HWB5_9SPHN|nr:hypothetical protein [Rhizorhapis suberifaciens]
MPPNPGFNPFATQDNAPMCDLKYRNEWIVRRVNPNKFRWKPWKPGYQSPGDIISYQIAKGE